MELLGRYSNWTYWVKRLPTSPKAATAPPTNTHRDRTVLRRLSGTEIKELVAGYLHGASVYELGVRNGIHRTTVSAHLHREGIPVRGRSMNDAEVARAELLYLDGMSLARVGQRLGFDGETVRLALRARGVRMRHPYERS